MRMQDEASGNPVGGTSEHGVQQPQDERRAVQSRAFTRWMNVFLQRRDPPVKVRDLFLDIQDGRVLMALLEELSGCQLLYRFRPSSHRIFRLNNISKALAFLDDRHVKLPGIDASSIADGTPSAVLNLLWNVILYFQVKKVLRGLQRHLSASLSSLSSSSYPFSCDLSPQPSDTAGYSCSTLPSRGRRAAREPRYHGKAIQALLRWVQRCTSKFGVEVCDFGRSWRSGLAFLAMVKSIDPDLVDLRETLSRQPRENMQLAFSIAQHSLDIPRLLEPEDVSGPSPDEQSVITYVSMFLEHCSGTEEDHTTHFGSLESVSSAEILPGDPGDPDDPAAHAGAPGLEGSSEQLLWRRWARRSSGTPRSAARPIHPETSRSPGVPRPPSPLDAGGVGQDIRSWMENASEAAAAAAGGRHPSLSSEEGIYSLPALDSDEEDAYRYILDLKDEGCPPRRPLRTRAARGEEEPEDGVSLRGEKEPEDGVSLRGEEEPEDGVSLRGEEEPEDGVSLRGEEEPEDGVSLRGEEEPEDGVSLRGEEEPEDGVFLRGEEEPEDGVFLRAEEEPEDGVSPRGEEEPEDGVFLRGEEEPEDGVSLMGEEEPEDGVFLRGEEEPEDGVFLRGEEEPEDGVSLRGEEEPEDGVSPRGEEEPEDGVSPRGEEEPEDGVFLRGEEEPEDGVSPRGEEEPEDGVSLRGEEEPEDGVSSRGKEEPEDGVSLRGERTEETQHLDVFETMSNGRHGEDSGGRLDPEVRAPSGAERTGLSRETAHNASVFEDVVPGRGGGGGDPRVKQTVQEGTDGDGAVERRRREGEAPAGERKDASRRDGEGWRTEDEEEAETRGRGIEDEEEEEGNVPKIEEGRERKSAVHVRGAERGGAPARPAAAQSFRDLTPSELQALLFLWILVYCCLIL